MKAYCVNENDKIVTARNFKTEEEANKFCKRHNKKDTILKKYWTCTPQFLKGLFTSIK